MEACLIIFGNHKERKMKKLFFMFPLCLVFLFSGGLAAEQSLMKFESEPMKSVLNTATHSLDHLMSNTLASLELIAMTPDAKNGEWY